MELRRYWLLLRRWIWLLTLGSALAAATAFLVSRAMPPEYEAATTLLVVPGSTQSLDNYSALMATQQLARTYAQLIDTEPVLAETYRRLGLPVSTAAAGVRYNAFEVTAAPVRDTQLVRVVVTGTDPALSARAADTLVQVFIAWSHDVYHSRYTRPGANLAAEMARLHDNIRETEATIALAQAASHAHDLAAIARLEDQLAQYRTAHATLTARLSTTALAEAGAGDTVTAVVPASVPSQPVRPRTAHNTLLAAAAGAMLAAAVACLVEHLDDTVKQPAALEALGLPLMATVHRIDRGHSHRPASLFALTRPRSHVAESYRTLRTNLHFSSLDRPLRRLVVTSAVACEGKTTTAANLALVVAQSGKRVVLVDADLRRPAVHQLFDLPNTRGLTAALRDPSNRLDAYLQPTPVENLRVLTSGPLPPNPQELLASQRMQDLLHLIQQEADLVLVDTPAALPVADATVLAARADGVLIVVNAGHTRHAALHQAATSLRQAGANLLGVVLNRVDPHTGHGYDAGYYDSHHGDANASGRRDAVRRALHHLRRRRPPGAA